MPNRSQPHGFGAPARCTRSIGKMHSGNYGDSIGSGIHGFIYDSGAVTPLDVPGATVTFPVAINNRGDIAGYYFAGLDVHGFVYDKGAFAINKRGEIAGQYAASDNHVHGFVYDNGTFTTVDEPGSGDTFPVAINNRGEVAGGFTTSDLSSHGAFIARPSGKADRPEMAFPAHGAEHSSENWQHIWDGMLQSN
jgi:hypothetical protein